jgi:hypothetical protein
MNVMHREDAREIVSQLHREECDKVLGLYGFATYRWESNQVLRDAIEENLIDGTIAVQDVLMVLDERAPEPSYEEVNMRRSAFVCFILALLLSFGVVYAADDVYPVPICPNEGTVDMEVYTIPDHILYSGMKETQVTFHWETANFPEPENWYLEVWFWDEDRYTAYDTVPFSREFYELDVPWLALMEEFPPKFYVRSVFQKGYNRCGRTEWHLGDVRELHCMLEPVRDGQAWVYSDEHDRMVLTNVVTR